jgi:hypothetical protein
MRDRKLVVGWAGFFMGFVFFGVVRPALAGPGLVVRITPAAEGRQLVRASLPFGKNLLREGHYLTASDGRRELPVGLRVLTWHPAVSGAPRYVRRGLVTFPYDFKSASSVRFTFKARSRAAPAPSWSGPDVRLEGETVIITWPTGPALRAELRAPRRSSAEPPSVEVVESNAFFSWRRFHLPDAAWPRIIEARADALGGVVVIAHLQRKLPGDGWAPDLGWAMGSLAAPAWLEAGGQQALVTEATARHSFAEGKECALSIERGQYRLYHPTAALKRRGRAEAKSSSTGGFSYEYWRCTASDKVPMQEASWRRAEFAVGPVKLAPLTSSLGSAHRAEVDWRRWDELYGAGPPLALAGQPGLERLLRYHHDAIVNSMAQSDDWGNVTTYSDGQTRGGVFGMNRLNHCPPLFEEAWRSGDCRLREVALLWCDNFHDQSIWWGPGQTGGARYNNVRAQNRTPPDDDRSYMWRSNDSVSFCTKGYDAFFLAHEETGDPRMLAALEARVRYAARHVHADRGECRNIGDVRDFVRLHQFTGDSNYLAEAVRLFRQLRTKLSPGDLFSQGGQPLVANPPFIDDDEQGYRHPFAKPYIAGYALAGLPELARLAPRESKLRAVIQAVADFLAESQDPLGGWRYPHPRSSYVILSQGLEHAWQLTQAAKVLGPQQNSLAAIERVLRQRFWGWQQTGQVFAGLTGWEIATGKVKARAELYSLYQRPEDRDFTRDYREGQAEFGSSAPEGLVYFPEVLRFYLRHRPAARLLAPPATNEPLGQVLQRVRPR